MKKILELLLCILHPLAVVLIWINLLGRSDLGLSGEFCFDEVPGDEEPGLGTGGECLCATKPGIVVRHLRRSRDHQPGARVEHD